MNLDEIRGHMQERDFAANGVFKGQLADETLDQARVRILLQLADDVPDLLAELERAKLQSQELQKRSEIQKARIEALDGVVETATEKREETNRLLSETQEAVRNLLKAPHNSFNDAMWREKVKSLLPPAEKRTCLTCGGPRPCDKHSEVMREAPVPIRRGCICGPEGMCDYHRVTDTTTPRQD